MLDLLRDGGPPQWFVLLFGAMMLVDALLFARRPRGRSLGFQSAMTAAMLWTMVAGFTAGLGMSIGGLGRLPATLRDRWSSFLLAGISESLAIVVLGSAVLGSCWLLVAIGTVRLSEPRRAAHLDGSDIDRMR